MSSLRLHCGGFLTFILGLAPFLAGPANRDAREFSRGPLSHAVRLQGGHQGDREGVPHAARRDVRPASAHAAALDVRPGALPERRTTRLDDYLLEFIASSCGSSFSCGVS